MVLTALPITPNSNILDRTNPRTEPMLKGKSKKLGVSIDAINRDYVVQTFATYTKAVMMGS